MLLIAGRADDPDIFYRCGFDSDVTVLYAEDEKKRTLYVPGFEHARAEQEVSRVDVKKLVSIKSVLTKLKGPFTIPHDFPYGLAKHLSGKITVANEVFPERKRKNEEELQHIKDAQEAARQAIRLVETRLAECTFTNGVATRDDTVITCEDLKALARNYLIRRGYDCPDLIISTGSQTSLPHHRGAGPIKEGPVIIDIFPQSSTSKYYGDMTRTVVVGDDIERELWLAAVKDAHQLCVSMCTPGTKTKDIHEAAVQLLQERGFATNEKEGLIHSTGHGVGLNIHERPSMGPKSTDVLEEGMVVSIEPGLYYDVGVRYEDLILVQETPEIL